MKGEHIALSNFQVGALYSRTDIATTGQVTAPSSGRDPHWSSGIVSFDNAVLLLVTLQKEEYAYLDYVDGTQFWWQSQNQQTQSSPVLRKLSTGALPAHLLIRLQAKAQGKTMPFAYAGQLSTPIFDGEKPVTGLFELRQYQHTPSAALAAAYHWRPASQPSADNTLRQADLQLQIAQAKHTAAPHTAPVNTTSAHTAQEPRATYNVRSTDSSALLQADQVEDERQRIYGSIVRRRGQPAFRKALLSAYASKCAISGCGVIAVLEAAHIYPYRGEQTNHPSNGLLLRADIHTLFDLFLLSIHPKQLTVCLSPSLAGCAYANLQGQRIAIPQEPLHAPNASALAWHRQQCNW